MLKSKTFIFQEAGLAADVNANQWEVSNGGEPGEKIP